MTWPIVTRTEPTAPGSSTGTTLPAIGSPSTTISRIPLQTRSGLLTSIR
ncbi:MAG: hypothetical protein GY856_39670 [bacterium]|nr:hypothetical protein [bacterium]